MDALARSRTREADRYLAIVAGLVLLGALLLAFVRIPGPPCFFRLLFHLPCPLCGMTRSLEALWRGDLLASFRYHPLGAAVFAVCVAALVRAIGNCGPGASRVARLNARSAILLVLAVWLVRLGLAACGNRFFLW